MSHSIDGANRGHIVTVTPKGVMPRADGARAQIAHESETVKPCVVVKRELLLGLVGHTMLSMDPAEEQPEAVRQNHVFATTRWSVVLAARQRTSPESSAALETLCQVYWYPLYVYVRRRGYNSHDAADVTQGFFSQLLEKNRIAHVERSKGKFRSFLLASMKHFLANECDRARAAKRGGGLVPISIELGVADAADRLEPIDDTTAEREFERRWALTLLDCILRKLRAEYVAGGRQELFDGIKGMITPRDLAGRYGQIAGDLGMSEGAVKVAVHRLRKRYRELLVYEVAQTVSSAEQIDDEIADLFDAFSYHRKN